MEELRELFQKFARNFSMLDATCCSRCCGEDLSLIQSHILFEVRRRHLPSMQEVANALGVDVTTFSRQVKALVEMGLVQTTQDPNDRRVKLLSLTEKGQDIERQISDFMNRAICKILDRMTPFEQHVVISSLSLLNTAVREAQIWSR
ncbi:MAG: winged helix DNA-binding protein [Alicyclobacillus macrosporangiidus]|uniref:MarR family winged helix-turn-helix transcriptional regulator n=1 Tax=Alicyclobacillus macrosporangiidus TaxID=392015 RepID=UPI0026F2C855|nr:MarR family transcriptional regulator [Alicyclobacillus macrosporangiidus]MCL6600301.1 winged helix DNA-binding protein [Alicyclobacillus macrosporangiidus]